MQRFQNEPKFNVVSSRNNLPVVKTRASQKKDGAYKINSAEDKSIEFHSIALYVNVDNVTYFDSFRPRYIPKEIEKFIENNITNIYRKQTFHSII